MNSIRSMTLRKETTSAVIQRRTLWDTGFANLPMTLEEEVSPMRAAMVHGSWILRIIWLQRIPWKGF